MDSQFLITAIFLICCLISVVYGVVCYVVSYAEKVDNVKETSERYKFLLKISQEFDAEKLEPKYTYEYYMKSKVQLDRLPLNFITQMTSLVSQNIPPSDLVKKGVANQKKLQEIEKKLQDAPPYRTTESGLYSSIEKKLTLELEKQIKPVVPTFVISFCYVSPKGRNHYQHDYSFSSEDIQTFAKTAKKLEKDAEKRKQTIQYQRSLMSASLRYDIMKRDGFRCVLCGAQASEGVKLHVDHIRPVSKGGKTEWSNLRTLCDYCNLGKRDKFDDSGIN